MDLPQHVLRFWETRFPQIRPLKRAGGRRYYRPEDIERLRLIRRLLYDEGYTIKGVQKLFKEQGVQALSIAGEPAGCRRSREGRSPRRRRVKACRRRSRGAARGAGGNRGRRTNPDPGALARPVKQRAAVAALRPADALTIRAASECSAARLAH